MLYTILIKTSHPINYTYFFFINVICQFLKANKIKEKDKNRYLDDIIIIIHMKQEIFSEEMHKLWAEQVNDGYKDECIDNNKYNSGDNSVYAYGVTAKQPEDKKKEELNGESIA